MTETAPFGVVGTAVVRGELETNRIAARDEITAHAIARKMIKRGWTTVEVKTGAGEVLHTYSA